MKSGFLILPVLLAVSGLTMALTSDSGDAYVERVIDGDTVVLGDGSKVRLVGIDAPEANEPCGKQATEALRQMVEHRVVTVGSPASVQDKDRYGRLLRYLDTDVDPAASLLTSGLATARYDSTDGYDPHPRQRHYHALEAVAVAACPTLDADSRWYNDPDGYRKHIKDRREARQKREREAREARQKREREARAERRRQREASQEALREAQRRETERALERIERELRESRGGSGQPDGGYTGPRCYAPGGKTWTPC